MQIRPIYPILGAIIGFLIAHNKGKTAASKLLYAIVGGIIAYGLAFAALTYLLNDMLNSVKNMNQAQADKVAASICQFEKDLTYFRDNNQKDINNPFGYDTEIADMEARLEIHKEALATANYSYFDCKAVKNA